MYKDIKAYLYVNMRMYLCVNMRTQNEQKFRNHNCGKKEALSFAFNASLTSVNLARAFARQQGMALSDGSTKTLLHNAAMVERFIAMSGKSPNMRLNNTDFKVLLFYVVRAAV